MSVPVCYPAVDERVVGVLGHAPIEGSPWEVRAYATTCAWIATTVGDVLPGLLAAAELSADRRSEAVVALCERAEKVLGNLRKVQDRYGVMGSELGIYAFAFDEAQGQSWGAHTRAVTALDLIDTYAGQLRELARGSTAQNPAASWRQEPTDRLTRNPLLLRGWNEGSRIAYDADDPAQVHKSDQLDEQWAKVEAAKILMDGAWGTLETAAGTLVAVLKGLHGDGLDDGLRENASKVGHALHLDDVRTAVAEAARWVWDHLDDIATVVGLAAVVLCWVPVIGQVLAVASAALSVVVMVKELAEGDIAGAALAALGALTFGAGRATTAAIKVTNTARPAVNTGRTGVGLADDATRAGGAAASRAGLSESSAWREAAKSLTPSAIARDIGKEASDLRAAGITKPSSWVAPSNLVPDGFKVLSNHMVTPGSQLSSTTGTLATANTVSFTVDNLVTVTSAKPYLPGVQGEQP